MPEWKSLLEKRKSLPLFADGLKKIRNGLELAKSGKYSPTLKVGAFTAEQLAEINQQREEEELAPIDGAIVFNGKHLYNSRCVKNDYTIDEVIAQITSALSDNSVVSHDGSTAINNPILRPDGRGNMVNDRMVFECSEQKPAALIWSVIPLGDGKKPMKSKR